MLNRDRSPIQKSLRNWARLLQLIMLTGGPRSICLTSWPPTANISVLPKCLPETQFCRDLSLNKVLDSTNSPTKSYRHMTSCIFFKTSGVNVQVGGNDQWGNITAGTDLISRVQKYFTKSGSKEEDKPAYGMTVPLLFGFLRLLFEDHLG